ncbi:hypothetical protein OAU50_05740 [Planctomycetota bacterium]|nr:hypothetical protein [Planctomycetota bacterium]
MGEKMNSRTPCDDRPTSCEGQQLNETSQACISGELVTDLTKNDEPVHKKTLFYAVSFIGSFLLVFMLFLAALPFISDPNRDFRRTEGEAIAGTVKAELRAVYAKSGKVPYAGSEVVDEILVGALGQYVERTTYEAKRNGMGVLTVYMKDDHDGILTFEFSFETGRGAFEWSS